MVHTATIVEKGIKEAATDYVNRKWSISSRAPPPPPLSKQQSFSSGSGSFGRRNTSTSHVSVSVSQSSKCGKVHSEECMN
jgi:hypothetical protein